MRKNVLIFIMFVLVVPCIITMQAEATSISGHGGGGGGGYSPAVTPGTIQPTIGINMSPPETIDPQPAINAKFLGEFISLTGVTLIESIGEKHIFMLDGELGTIEFFNSFDEARQEHDRVLGLNVENTKNTYSYSSGRLLVILSPRLSEYKAKGVETILYSIGGEKK